jgi:hypothetical protein
MAPPRDALETSGEGYQKTAWRAYCSHKPSPPGMMKRNLAGHLIFARGELTMDKLVARWKAMKLELEDQMQMLRDGRLATRHANQDTTEDAKERIGSMIIQLDALLEKYDPAAWP